MADSKTQKLVEAAKTRMQAERELDENNNSRADARAETDKTDEDKRAEKNRIEAAKEMAKVKVQARANTIDGEIDVEARGDVKGDGGDAKDYPDDDPDKALGIPVYEHGLHETTVAGEKFGNSKTLFGDRISPRTQAEMDRGKKSLSNSKSSRSNETRRASSTRTAVTDANTDPDGEQGKAEAERKAEEAKAEEAKKKAAENKK